MQQDEEAENSFTKREFPKPKFLISSSSKFEEFVEGWLDEKFAETINQAKNQSKEELE